MDPWRPRSAAGLICCYEAVAWLTGWPTISRAAHLHGEIRMLVLVAWIAGGLLLNHHFDFYGGP